jgi:AcrR family transcriptional regulator
MVEAIVEAAARILEEEGFLGYTTNAVARRAGVSVGSLYQYFPGRDAITRALILRETSALLAEADAVAAEPTGRAGLERLIGAAVAHQLRRPVLARLLDIEESRLPLSEDVGHVGAQLRAAISRVLDAPDMAWVQRHPSDAEDILAITKGMIDAAGQRDERDDRPLRRRVERAVFGYLAPQSGNSA